MAVADHLPLQTTTAAPLVDGFGRRHNYLRISLTERCNLRCQYCMPPEGVELSPRDHMLSFEEIERVAGLFAALGVDKIRLTGGEPLVRKDAAALVARLDAIPGIETLAMTTNGMLLAEQAAALKAAGLTALNISLDTLQKNRFEKIALRPGLDKVLAGIDAALAAGFEPVKINMVVMGGVNDDEVCDMAALALERPLHVRFIEYMPFGGNRWSGARMVPWRVTLARLAERFALAPAPEPDPHAAARVWRTEGMAGTVGFIASMTDSFCAGCNRLRLTADGKLKPCLHDGYEADLRGPLRAGADDAELEGLIRAAVARKAAAHAPAEELAKMPNRSMIRIGG